MPALMRMHSLLEQTCWEVYVASKAYNTGTDLSALLQDSKSTLLMNTLHVPIHRNLPILLICGSSAG